MSLSDGHIKLARSEQLPLSRCTIPSTIQAVSRTFHNRLRQSRLPSTVVGASGGLVVAPDAVIQNTPRVVRSAD
jgi:hypothetical protein